MLNNKVVMGLSGGMDSSTLLGYLLREDKEVHCCIFTYGSKHNKYENSAASNVAEFYQKLGCSVFIHRFDFSHLTTDFKSDLLQSGGDIPEGHYNDENMRSTVVPGRNLIFLSIMAGLAESIGAGTIALGVHAGDHHIYPDCRAEFIKAADLAVYLSSDKKVAVVAPFQSLDKAGILRIGYGIGYGTGIVPYVLTRTCYKDQERSCGKCGSCQERLEAFKLIGKIDPIVYATGDKTCPHFEF
jgi:7-cyano-7-deazaguanine synthase